MTDPDRTPLGPLVPSRGGRMTGGAPRARRTAGEEGAP